MSFIKLFFVLSYTLLFKFRFHTFRIVCTNISTYKSQMTTLDSPALLLCFSIVHLAFDEIFMLTLTHWFCSWKTLHGLRNNYKINWMHTFNNYLKVAFRYCFQVDFILSFRTNPRRCRRLYFCLLSVVAIGCENSRICIPLFGKLWKYI